MTGKFLSENHMIQGTNKTILDYWKWGHSAILDNTERGVLAEFLVGSALGALEHPRIEWENADIQYRDYHIEVKSSAYVQSWEQSKISSPSFGIAPKRAWAGRDNIYEKEKRRFAQYYIFCLLNEKDHEEVDPLNINQWEFYILPTKVLDQHYKTQKTISLTPLQSLCCAVTYHEIKSRLDKLI